jgi:3-oxoacyl-[acyl-carrier protein] reductase
MSASERVAVVTGAASGIGLAIAERLAHDAHSLVLVDRSDAVHALAERLRGDGIAAESAVVDVADHDRVRELTGDLTARHGRCDILVNNAGVHPKRPDGGKVPIPEISFDQWQQVIAVNLTAPFLLAAWALELMKRRRWGRIVNISSRAGRVYSDVAGAHYSATKAALIGFTRVLAGEGGPFNVTANCVAPGRVRTPLSDQGGDALHEGYARTVPVARIGRPEEIAAAVAFLASDDASFVTGSVVDANGGVFG